MYVCVCVEMQVYLVQIECAKWKLSNGSFTLSKSEIFQMRIQTVEIYYREYKA